MRKRASWGSEERRAGGVDSRLCTRRSRGQNSRKERRNRPAAMGYCALLGSPWASHCSRLTAIQSCSADNRLSRFLGAGLVLAPLLITRALSALRAGCWQAALQGHIQHLLNIIDKDKLHLLAQLARQVL